MTISRWEDRDPAQQHCLHTHEDLPHSNRKFLAHSSEMNGRLMHQIASRDYRHLAAKDLIETSSLDND